MEYNTVCVSNKCGDGWTMIVGSIEIYVSPKGQQVKPK